MRGAIVLVSVSSVAGALAVPPHPAWTPVSATLAGLVAIAGLRVRRWSRLPAPPRAGALPGWRGVVGALLPFAAGFGFGLAVLAMVRSLLVPALPAAGARLAAAGALPVGRRLLIVFTAAVGEELVFRLVLLSFLAGLAARWVRGRDAVPRPRVVRFAIGVSALAFALAHLPAWTAATVPTTVLVLAVVALNAAGGILFGGFFVTRGIGAAMWAHAGADVATLLVGPLTI